MTVVPDEHGDVLLAAEPAERIDQCLSFEYARIRRPDGCHRTDTRFASPHKISVDHLERCRAVGAATGQKRLELGDLILLRRHDQFAASLMGDRMPLAKFVKLFAPSDTQLRLERAGRVINAGMNHAAVMGAHASSRT